MSQETETHVIAMMCTAQNYTKNPNINQDTVDFSKLQITLANILSSADFDVVIQIPNFYLDLKATSDLQRRGPTGLHDHLMQMEERLQAEQRGDQPVFDAVTAIELNDSLNAHDHCPALFPLVVTATPECFLKWSNERLTNGLSVGKNPMNVAEGVMPKACVDLLSSAFEGAVKYQQTFMFRPLNGEAFQSMLFNQIREELPENKRKSFDKELEKVGEKLARQA